jgi:cysteine synthase A
VNVFASDYSHSLSLTKPEATKSPLDLIGNTPLLELATNRREAKIYAKAEFQNPTGSIKDRMVSNIVQQAELRGELKPGQTIVEATSGNTGVSLAMVAAIKNYKAVIVAPDSTSSTKKNLMKMYGAELLLTDNRKGINATVEKARKVAEERGAYLLNQFKNPDNPKAHHSTGKEILNQVRKVDVFVAGVGTGGTLVGVGEVLKQADPCTRLVAVEPYTAPALYNMFHGRELPIEPGIPHRIEGIGESFVPEILLDNLWLIDHVVLARDEDAFNTVQQVGKENGYCVGISSGANIHAAKILAAESNNQMNTVTVLPDSGQRYLEHII